MPTVPRRPQAHRKRQQLQARRLRAAELFTVGVHPAEVARTWHAAWRTGGTSALQAAARCQPGGFNIN